jgi:hypothetical protein
MIREALFICGLTLLCGLLGASAVQHEIARATHSLAQFLGAAQ